jgi:flagellar biosynthesis/type III secretory pathway chaperone
MSASPDERRARFERIVEDSISEALALELALQAERHALETRDDAALGGAAENKAIHIARLEHLEAERRGFPAADLLPGAGGQWQALLSIVARCKRMNSTNGAIVHLRRQQVNDALRLLSGTGIVTYAPSGAETPSAGRALAAI